MRSRRVDKRADFFTNFLFCFFVEFQVFIEGAEDTRIAAAALLNLQKYGYSGGLSAGDDSQFGRTAPVKAGGGQLFYE
jgi:hypothetical protein